MTNEIERYQQPASTLTERAPTELDQWVLVIRDVSRLASQIADTPFVPDGMRGNPAAVTAAMLMGREMNLGPMTSLQHLNVIKGKVGKSAEIMRAMVLAAGHEIRDIEVTDTRCVLEGRRRGDELWTRVTFTADQARRAKIDLGGYPEDKLYARATTRLCRRRFADVVGGIAATLEELEDGDAGDHVEQTKPDSATTAEPAKRTAKRRTPTRATAERLDPSAEPDKATGDTTTGEAPAGPPLPGEAGYDDAGGPAADSAPAEPVNNDQLTKLHVQLGEFGIDDRADKLTTVSLLARRELASSKDLTKTEASGVIELLERLLADDDPSKALDAVLAAFEETEKDGDG